MQQCVGSATRNHDRSFHFPCPHQQADVHNEGNFANFSSNCNDNRHPTDFTLELIGASFSHWWQAKDKQRQSLVRVTVYGMNVDDNNATFYASGITTCTTSSIRFLWHLSSVSLFVAYFDTIKPLLGIIIWFIFCHCLACQKSYFLQFRIWFNLLNKENYLSFKSFLGLYKPSQQDPSHRKPPENNWHTAATQ